MAKNQTIFNFDEEYDEPIPMPKGRNYKVFTMIETEELHRMQCKIASLELELEKERSKNNLNNNNG